MTRDIYPDKEFLEHLASGRFMLQRARPDGRPFFYPRVAEPGTGNRDLEWIEASGLGTVYATTVVRQRDDAQSYNVCLVDLDEGPRMMSRVEGIAPGEVTIGMRVQAKLVRTNETYAVIFTPCEE